ncbi:MAG TPA: hypothetical protein VFB65_17605 [Pyrinomonadaceae bacterium]|nr:hypothetical protein [Pyrinomonadaceae bacterium]
MIKFYPTVKALFVVTFILALASAAQAQATRTWVSGVGDDVNPCSRTAPCKTFAGAISKTAKDGEISVLDPGGYGAVTITKSIYINGTHGAGYGSIIASLVNGVIINITDPADVRKAVRLRALDINGASTGINGISILAANNVWVEDSVIDGFTGDGTNSGMGIRIATTAAVTTNVYVSDTMIHKTHTGVRVSATAGFAVLNLRNSNIEGNTNGVTVNTNGFATIESSRVAANTTNGVATIAATGTITIRDSILSNNGTAINAAAGSTVRAVSNILNNNTTGFGGTTAVIQTDGQNRSIANGGGGPGGGLVTIQ